MIPIHELLNRIRWDPEFAKVLLIVCLLSEVQQ